MKNISLDIKNAKTFLKENAIKDLEPSVRNAQEALESGNCLGNDFLGWLHLPSSITAEDIDRKSVV